MKVLLDLKGQYKALTGTDYQPPGAKKQEKKGKDKKGKGKKFRISIINIEAGCARLCSVT